MFRKLLQATLTLGLLATGILRQPAPITGSAARANTIADLPPAARSLVAATLGQADLAYQFVPSAGGYRAQSRASALSADFSSGNVRLSVNETQWAVALRAIGYGEALEGLSNVAPHATGNRVEYARASFTEWYVNGPAGLEQGFTLTSPPVTSPFQGEGPGVRSAPLTLAFTFSGNLMPALEAGHAALDLANARGDVVLRYTGLGASDATGRALPAWLELAPTAAAGGGQGNGRLLLRVDDAQAQYPVTIDPYFQVAKLTASDGAQGNALGDSVAVSADGSTIAAGAPFAAITGTVYVFVKPNGGWVNGTQVARLTTLAPEARELGYSVAVSGDGSTIVAGTLNGFAPHQPPGAAFVFVKPNGGWVDAAETAKLHASGGSSTNGNFLGHGVAVNQDGSLVVAGAPNAVISNTLTGAVYVFAKPNGGWSTTTETAVLTATFSAQPVNLGDSVAVAPDGSTIVAGDEFSLVNGIASGAAFVFLKPNGGWKGETQAARLTASLGKSDERIGTAVALSADGSTIVVGAPGTPAVLSDASSLAVSDPSSPLILPRPGPGAAYVFVKPNTGWADVTQTARLTASDANTATPARAGVSVAISSDGSLVAAGAEHESTVAGSGAVYLFERPAGGWMDGHESGKLQPTDTAVVNQFGSGVALKPDGANVMVGAGGATANGNANQGAVYVFGPAPYSLYLPLVLR